MTTATSPQSKSILQPIERLSEILFGLIMVLTFTGSLSVATADRVEVRVMLIGALGCNIAWGIIDGILYLMACLHERGQEMQTIRAVRQATSSEVAHEIIRASVPRVVAPELSVELLERIRERVMGASREVGHPRLTADDVKGAAGIFVIVVLSTLPVVTPFLFVSDVALAMRLSNAIAIAMLALIGYFFGRASGLSPGLTGLFMVFLGLVLVGLTIALGG